MNYYLILNSYTQEYKFMCAEKEETKEILNSIRHIIDTINFNKDRRKTQNDILSKQSFLDQKNNDLFECLKDFEILTSNRSFLTCDNRIEEYTIYNWYYNDFNKVESFILLKYNFGYVYKIYTMLDEALNYIEGPIITKIEDIPLEIDSLIQSKFSIKT